MKIKWTLLISIGTVLFVIMSSSFFYIYKSQENQAEANYYDQAISISHDLGLVRHIIQGAGGIYVKKDKGFETNPYLAQNPNLDVDIQDEKGNNYTMLNSFAFIRHMTQEDGIVHNNKDDFIYRTPSLNAKNSINAADEFEVEILNKFQNGEISEYTNIEQDENGSRVYRYMNPYIANDVCMKCHPLIENVGDVIGAISITIPIEEAEIKKEESLNRILLFFLTSSFILMGVVYTVSDRMAKPIIDLSQASERIRKGELGVKIESKSKTEEITTLGSTFNLLTTELQEKISQLSTDIIKRKEAEKKLKESEEKYRDLFENANDLIQSVGSDGKFQFVNQKWLDTLGYTREELDNLTFMDVIKKDQIHHCQRLLENLKNGRSIDHVETVFVTKSGEEVIVEGNANGQFKDGKFITSRGIFRNITARKKAEEAQAYLANITENSHDAIASLDLDGTFTSWNKGAEEIFGYTKEEIIGKPHGFIVPDDKKHTCINPLLTAEEDGFIKGEGVRRAKDGREIPIESTLSRLDDHHGNHIGYTFIMRDITERREAEEAIKKAKDELEMRVLERTAELGRANSQLINEISERKQVVVALRANEEKYSTLVEKGNDGIVIIQDGNLKFLNSKMIEITGFDKDEAIGMPLIDFISPDYKEIVASNYKKRMAGEYVPSRYEIAIASKSGQSVPIEINTSLIEYENKPADMAIVRDITVRKKSEEALKMAYEELKSIDTLKSDIFSNVSHELKTPITIIRASIELALEDTQDGETIDLMKTVLDALKRQEGIINDLLVAADMGKINLKINLQNISDLIKINANQKSILTKKNGIVIETDIEDNLPLIPLDREKIEQVLVNLIDNAIKYNKKNGKIKIRCSRKDDNLEVVVSDTGEGIKEEDMQKLFQPLTQLDPSSRRAHGGTGTGLAVVKAIVKAHGGKIWAESKYGEGSTFYFSIPVVRY